MHQKAFGGRALPGPAEGAYKHSLDSSRNMGPILLRGGREGDRKKGSGGEGERKRRIGEPSYFFGQFYAPDTI